MPQTIFCDESGFTGTRLSDEAQPYFVYASVALSPEKADEIVRKAIKDFRLQSSEIKGSKLSKSDKGRKVLSFFLNQCLKDSQVAFFHKKYALAGKLFEYIFEPALSNKSAMFYGIGFHKFISTLVFVELQTERAPAEKLLRNFEDLLRSRNPEGVAAFFDLPTTKRRTRSVAKEIQAFCIAQQRAIAEELKSIEELGRVGKWTLDLTDTAVYSLLCFWGERFDQLDVFCDESKPLFAHLQVENSVFAAMIGRTDKQYFDFGNGSRPFTFNLFRAISLANSKDSCGIQIADAIAASLSYALRNRKEGTAKRWLMAFGESSAVHPDSNIPDLDVIDVRKPEAARNKQLFLELVRRCRAGSDLLDGIEDFIRFGWMLPKRRK